MELEGVRLLPYIDSAGILTVGVGHVIKQEDNIKEGEKISYNKAMSLLIKDLEPREKDLSKRIGDVPQHKFDGLFLFGFNLGMSRVSKLKNPRDILKYIFAGGKPIRGLLVRRWVEFLIVTNNKNSLIDEEIPGELKLTPGDIKRIKNLINKYFTG